MFKRTKQNVRSPLLVAAELDIQATLPGVARLALLSSARVDAASRRSFMASLSHGPQTPLRNVYGCAERLGGGIRGPSSGDEQHDVRSIRGSDRHLLKVGNSVIDFARWEHGDPPALEDVLVRDAVEQAESRVAGGHARPRARDRW